MEIGVGGCGACGVAAAMKASDGGTRGIEYGLLVLLIEMK
jgi:hypothetical protein